MAFWFFLSDPEDYSFDELFRKKKETWDGVFGGAAQRYLSGIRRGDRVIGYHTAPEKQAVALLEVTSDAYQNPEIKDKSNWVVDLKPLRKFTEPIPLAQMKANARLSKMKLFQIPRPIAVSPLTQEEFNELLRQGGLSDEVEA